MKMVIDIPEPLYNYALGLPNKTTLGSYGVYPMLTDIAFAVKGGQPLPEDAEMLTAEEYSELCKHYYKSGYHDGVQDCTKQLRDAMESRDESQDDEMFGDYMSPIV